MDINVNVASQQRDPASLLNWIEHLIRTRKQCPEFGQGDWQILETDNPYIFAHCCHWEGKTVIAIHNLSDRPCRVTLPLCKNKHLYDLFGDDQYESCNNSEFPLNAYGYRWFRFEEN